MINLFRSFNPVPTLCLLICLQPITGFTSLPGQFPQPDGTDYSMEASINISASGRSKLLHFFQNAKVVQREDLVFESYGGQKFWLQQADNPLKFRIKFYTDAGGYVLKAKRQISELFSRRHYSCGKVKIGTTYRRAYDKKISSKALHSSARLLQYSRASIRALSQRHSDTIDRLNRLDRTIQARAGQFTKNWFHSVVDNLPADNRWVPAQAFKKKTEYRRKVEIDGDQYEIKLIDAQDINESGQLVRYSQIEMQADEDSDLEQYELARLFCRYFGLRRFTAEDFKTSKGDSRAFMLENLNAFL